MNVELFNPNRKVIKVDNSLFLKEFELTLEEMRLILLTMAQIDINDEDFKTYKIAIKDIVEKTGAKKNKSRIADMIEKLMKKIIVIEKDNGEVREYFHWFSYIKHIKGEAAIEVRFDPALKPYLLQLKEKFVKLNLDDLLKLNSIYAIRFYIIARVYKNLGQIKFLVEELNDKLKTPKSYRKDFSLFKKNVLEIAKKEINEKTDLNINFEYVTKGKKVAEVILKINGGKATKTLSRSTSTFNLLDFKSFKNNLSKSDVIITYNDEEFQIKDGYIWKDEKILSKEDALRVWKMFYENKDNIKVKTLDEVKKELEEKKNRQIKLLKEIEEFERKYKNTHILGLLSGEKMEFVVGDVVMCEDEKIKIYFHLHSKFSVSIKVFNNLQEAQEFIEKGKKFLKEEKNS